MKVGITFFLQENGNIWNSGAVQQCVFLAMCLRRIPGAQVVAINAGYDIPVPKGLDLDGSGIEFVRLPEVIDSLDLLVQCHGQVSAADVDRVRSNGGKAIAYKFGNEYVIDGERMMRGQKSGAIVNGAQFDEIWTNEQHINTCGSYWKTVYRCPVRVVPHIWSPYFIDKLIRKENLAFGYEAGRTKKRIAIYEPNINIVKMAFIPILICETVYRRHPERIKCVLATNTKQMMEQVTFQNLCKSLDIVKDKAFDGYGVCSFQGRSRFPSHQANHADIVVSHQWENGLNYAYYEALYGGYPLIHNSDLMPYDLGYRYTGFDIESGADALINAMDNHDDSALRYEDASKAFLSEVDAESAVSVEAYDRAIGQVAS